MNYGDPNNIELPVAGSIDEALELIQAKKYKAVKVSINGHEIVITTEDHYQEIAKEHDVLMK